MSEKQKWVLTAVATLIFGILLCPPFYLESSGASPKGVTKSELKVVGGIPKILINGEDKITFVNHIYYFTTYDPFTGTSLDDYGKGKWLAGVKSQIAEMNKNGANTLVLDIYWSDLVTVESRPSSVEGSINFLPLDQAMAYAKEKNIYVLINPKIDVFLAKWWEKENNFPRIVSRNMPDVKTTPCIPQEKNSNHACIPKEICTTGDSRCCSVPKDQLYCCNLDLPDPKPNQPLVSGVSVGLTENGLVKCKKWNNNQIYSKCTECETDSYGWKYSNPGMSAETFRKDYSDYLTALVNHYKDNPALIGWVFSLGPSGEDQYGPSYIALRQIYRNLWGQSKTDQVADYSDDAQQKFKIWIKNKYGSDEKLQEAWRDRTLSLESIKLPDPKKLFKQGREGPFPDDFFVGFHISLDALTQRGTDLYEFREYIRDLQRDHFTKLIKSLDKNHVLAYFGANNDGIYNNSSIDALIGANHVEYAVDNNSEANFIAVLAALNKKHGKANIFALESAGETGGIEGKSTDKEKQKKALLDAFKVMKCMGSHLGYVSSFRKDMPTWSSTDLEVLKQIGSYTPGENCICDLVKPGARVMRKTVSELVRIFGLKDYYSCRPTSNVPVSSTASPQTDMVQCMQDCLRGGERASECEAKCEAPIISMVISPDSKYLYIFWGERVYQYELPNLKLIDSPGVDSRRY